MFVFGTTVGGFAKEPPNVNAVTAAPNDRNKLNEVLTLNENEDSTIGQLELEEKKLLDELEATRARLKLEVETRILQAEREQDHASLAFYEAIAPQQLPPKNVRAVVKKNRYKKTTKYKKPLGENKLPSGENLPCLATTAERPFDVGLAFTTDLSNRDNSHILPIFQLPTVTPATKFVNSLPKEPSDEERKRIEEETKERLKIQSLLGLTDEEAAEFDAIGVGPPPPYISSDENLTILDRVEGNEEGDWERLPTLANTRSLSDKTLRGSAEKATSIYLEKKRPAKSRRNGESNNSEDLRKNKHKGSNMKRLRYELTNSIQAVHHYTSSVQRDLVDVHKLCPVNDIRAQMYMKKWGFAKLENMFIRIQANKLYSGFQMWVQFVVYSKREEKRQLYMKTKGTNKLSRVMTRMLHKKVDMSFKAWADALKEIKKIEYLAKLSKAATIVQRNFRGHEDRKLIDVLRAQKKAREESKASTKIQAIFRGKKDRKKVSVLEEKRKIRRACIKVQRNFRLARRRRREAEKRARRKLENQMALKIQCAWRRKQGKMSLHLKRQAKREAAAVRLQAKARQRHAKKRIRRLKVDRKEYNAAVSLQRRFRGMRGRKIMEKRRARREEERQKEERFALRLQAIYRGHRGRLIYQLKAQAKRAELAVHEEGVTKIQAMFRGKVGRRNARQRKDEVTAEYIEWSREWVETYKEEQNCYAFLNNYTGEEIYEPPPQGYTKENGLLALADGRELEDPLIIAERERQANLVRCIECEDAGATRSCNDCGDVYCDDCYESIHVKGKYAEHTFEWFQDGGPYEESYIEYDETTENYQEETDGEYNDPYNEWNEFYDEDSGCPYWYNGATGETTWENPNGEDYGTGDEYATGEEYGTDFNEASIDDGQYGGQYDGEAGQGAEVWEEYYDEENACPYWYNAGTGESTYEDPQQNSSNTASAAQATTEVTWEEYFDEDSQLPYWYDANTGETTWESPY